MPVRRNVTVREVGLRDGLQLVKEIFPTAAKKQWITEEAAAGVPEIEVCAFVSPKAVPQFGDHEEVVAHALSHPGLVVSALVPNAKGARRGFELGVHKLNFVISASETHNLKNVRCTTAESLARFEEVIAARREDPAYAKTSVAAGISTALGCTMEGPIETSRVMWLCEELLKRGAEELAIADTVGYANPAQVRAMFTEVIGNFGKDVEIAAHFHDTRGLGLANVVTAMEAGCRIFDASLAGLGGCPFAPSATGNIVMDDLVFMLESMGLRTGVDLDCLLGIRRLLDETLPDEPKYGLIARAGLPKGFHGASAAG